MSDNVEKTAGALALEECAKLYADITAQEVELGFGDCHCDWRAPLAKVEIYKKAMAVDGDTTDYTTYAYDVEGETVTAAEAVAKADEYHAATEGKKELLKRYYPEVFAERYPDEVGADAEPAESGN